MEQRLAALFASVGNALDSSTYTYSDSDYLVRKALVEFLDGENALVASARKIQDSTEAVDSILNYIVSTDFSAEDPADWYRKAARIVVEFSDFAFRNEMSADSARYAALLPEGHPRALNSLTLTASAQRNALAEWMAADPRLTEEASAQIFKLYSMSDEASELDIEFEYLKAEAMVASGAMPEELLPLTAAFNLTRAQRSAISSFFAQFRRRDRKGRFAEEFGRLSLIFSTKKGDFFSQAPKVVGPGRTPEKVVVEFDGSDSRIPKGLYEVDAALGENVKAYLPVSAVKDLPKGKEVVAEADKKFAIGLDDLLAAKLDTPLNWEKSGKGFKAKDGKFVAEPVSIADAQKAIDRAGERGDDLIIAGTGEGDAFDPNASQAFLVADSKGKTLGVAQDWAGIQEIAAANGATLTPAGASEAFDPFKRPEDGFPELKTPGSDSKLDGLRPFDGRDVQATNRNSAKRAERKRLEDSLGRKLTPEEISALDLELESESFVGKRPMYEGAEFFIPGQDPEADAKYKAYEKKRAEVLRKLNSELEGKKSSPDLNQDAAGVDKSKLSPSLIGEGYGFSKDGENSWVKEGTGENGESYTVSQGKDGKWVVSESSGSGPDNFKEKDLESFDNALDAFEYANDQGASPSEFDEDWVNELMSEGGADLDQDTVPMNKINGAKLSPEAKEAAQKYIDDVNDAVFNNNRAKLNDVIAKAALDSNVTDEAYAELVRGRDAQDVRGWEVENALADGSQEELEELLNNPEYAGWASRIEDALASYGEDGGVDLNQDAPVLSEKQSEPASGKQYAFLQEFLDERNLDPATEQAFKDALENKNLNKAQASAMIGLGRAADFKPGVDPNKPSERMLSSLQGYLATKDLAPSEIKDVLDSLQNDGSRDNVDALLNKLRRKKDKPADLNQGVSSLTKYSDNTYAWEDSYNNVGVNRTKNGWEVEYTNPDLNERGGQTWHNEIFNSEEEALKFAELLIEQNQNDGGYDRAADDQWSGFDGYDPDLDQDVKGTLADSATDKQYDFLKSLLEGKKIDDPALEAAVRSAVEDRNLSKGEVGAFIGALRNLENKPNVRREPSAKQIASIKRAILERGLSSEERKSIEDRLAEGISFDEASEILNDLKSRPITDIDALINELMMDSDLDTLKYIYSKPEYAPFQADILDAIQTMRRNQGDTNFDPEFDMELGPDLDQNVSSSESRNRLVDKMAEELDALESFAVDGDELKSYLEEFDRTDFPYTAAEMSAAIYRMSNYVDDPDLKQRLRALSESLDQEIEERFGIAEAARVVGEDDPLDLDEVADDVDAERQMHFETDVDAIAEKLEENGSYGDNRSGGAEGRVSENEDGTFTARVDYDRDNEEQTFEDYEDAIAWAANKIARYNEDVIPTTYREDFQAGMLAEEAKNARTDKELEDVAAAAEAIADDLDGNRGDPRLARRLRTYGERIRDMIAAREARNQSEAPSDVLTPETMEEMITDPDLNPKGYASYVGDDLFSKMQGNEKNGLVDGGEYISNDGRVKVTVTTDADFDGENFTDASSYVVEIDGNRVGSGSGANADDIAAEAQRMVEDHFSKKA